MDDLPALVLANETAASEFRELLISNTDSTGEGSAGWPGPIAVGGVAHTSVLPQPPAAHVLQGVHTHTSTPSTIAE